MQMRIFFVVIAISTPTWARVITEDFSGSTRVASTSTGVWNLVLKRLHVPFIVDRTAGGGENENDNVPIGTAKHGEFSAATYANFDVNLSDAATSITLDTGTLYEFTTFTLESGTTLYGHGSKALQIRVHGNVLIKGRIDLRGGAGGSITTDTASNPSGGSACCGGGAGGRGGGNAASASDGTSANSTNTGLGRAGAASSSSGNGSGGGGGGGFESAPSAATAGGTPAGGGSGGAEGSSYGDVYLTTLLGGSGGGGGAAYTLGGVNNSSGGGGAGGGGAIQISAGGNIQITSTGEVLAKGGAGGGTSSGSLLAGCGGGGAGGAIVLMAAGQYNNEGKVNADRSSGGSGSSGGAGGNGAVGRTWLVDSRDFTTWPSLPPGAEETPSPNMSEFGRIYYSKTSYVVESDLYDTKNSSPSYDRLETDEVKPSGSSIGYELAGSSDQFASDTTGFVSSSQISQLNGKRYFKFRVTMQSANRESTPEVRAIRLHIIDHVQYKFLFETSGCARIHPSDQRTSPLGMLIFLSYLILITKAPGYLLDSSSRKNLVYKRAVQTKAGPTIPKTPSPKECQPRREPNSSS